MAAAELTMTDILDQASDCAGFGFTCPADSTTNGQLVRRMVAEGLREFYSPPPIVLSAYQQNYVHNWSFLRPQATIAVWPDASGTIDSVSGDDDNIITADADVFYQSMVGKTLVVDGGSSYTITGYTSSTVIIVSDDASADSGKDFTITSDGNYRLPSDFGWLESGGLTYQPESCRSDVDIVGDGYIRRVRSTGLGSGYPTHAAVLPNTPDTASTGTHSGYLLCVYPAPVEVISLDYRYGIAPDALADLDREIPYGSNMHGSTILACVLAVVEREMSGGVAGPRTSTFMQRLVTSVKRDIDIATPDFIARREADVPFRPRHGIVRYGG